MALGYGSRGEEVKKLQREINAAGYEPPLVVDGIWGPKTEAGNKWYASLESENTDSPATNEPRTDTGEKERYTDGDARFIGLGGNPEIWYNSDTGDSYIVHFVPGTEPPIPMYWRIESDEHLQAYFGEAEVMYDRVLTNADMEAAGSLYQGLNTELVDRDGDPMVGIIDRIERDMAVRPYLKDPEVSAIIIAAALEGVAPSQTEFEQTEWWRTHTDGERAWLVKSASDPATAQQALEAGRLQVKQMLEEAGVYAPPDELVQYMADMWTMGTWDNAMLADQVNVVADPSYNGVMEDGLQSVVDEIESGGTAIDTTTDEVKWVADTARRWLGPTYGALTEEQINEIAGRIRNDPNYRDEWLASLQQQRVTLFPAYTDSLASYDEIAQSWRSVYFQTLGENADEQTTLFQNIVQQNDLATARQQLRQYGLESGNKKVTTEALDSFARQFGYGVRSVL